METKSTDTKDIEYAVRTILSYIGDNPEREGLKGTPERIVRMWKELFRGYDPEQAPKVTIFPNGKDGLSFNSIVADSGTYYSMCEHHMLPFIGHAHVAYIPNGYITGLSKIARVVEAFSRRLQVQERLTNDIKNCIQNTLNPLGVAVVIEAQHMCMMMRGVQKQNSVTTTSDFSGAFEKLATREEFIRLISNKFH